MQEIQRVISAASWRLGFANFLRGVVFLIAVLLGAAMLAYVVQQVFGLAFPWREIAYGCAGAALLGGLIYAIVARPSKDAVARRVDEGANLKESLSTALSVAPMKDDPWARAAVEQATRNARGVNVSQAVPIQAPRFWPVPLTMALAMVVLWIALPKMDVLGWNARKLAEETRQAQVVTAKAEAIEATKKIEDMMDKLGLEKEKSEVPQPETPTPRTPEDVKREAIKNLTKLQERLEQLREGEKGQKLDAIKNKLKQLRTPPGETSELAKSMAQGNFQQAQKEIEKIKEQMGAGALSDEKKQELSEQLDAMAKQLEEMAKNKESLEKALKEAGLDPSKAADPAALKQAMEQAQNLTQEQKQQLQEMAQSSAACQSAMDALSQAASQMSEAAKSGDQQAMDQAASQMSEQMGQMEQLNQEMQLAEAAMSECESQMGEMGKGEGQGDQAGEGEGDQPGEGMGQGQGQGQGNQPWSEGWSENRGDGSRGGPGLGQGGSQQAEKSSFDTETRKSIGKIGDGPIVSRRLVEGDSIRGESRAEMVRAIEKAEQNATEAIENNTIPREYHAAIKNYFGTLKSGGKNAPAKDAAPSTPTKPAEPAKDAGK